MSLVSVSDPKAEYVGTEPWNSKEVLEEGEITDKADIFSYGLTLWEMMTLSVPHLEMLDDEEEDDEGEIRECAFTILVILRQICSACFIETMAEEDV